MYTVVLTETIRVYLASRDVSQEPYDPSVEPDLAGALIFAAGTEGRTEHSKEDSGGEVVVTFMVGGGISIEIPVRFYKLEWRG